MCRFCTLADRTDLQAGAADNVEAEESAWRVTGVGFSKW